MNGKCINWVMTFVSGRRNGASAPECGCATADLQIPDSDDSAREKRGLSKRFRSLSPEDIE